MLMGRQYAVCVWLIYDGIAWNPEQSNGLVCGVTGGVRPQKAPEDA